MQSKLDYKTHTKNVDLEPLKNTQHLLATPQFHKSFLKLTYTQLQYSKKKIEYTWALQSSRTIE